MDRVRRLSGAGLSMFLLGACTPSADAPVTIESSADPLPSWTEGENKSRIIEFVESVTDPDGSQFVPVRDRVATFDMDGTLWVERPLFFQFEFSIPFLRARVDADPSLADQQPFEGALARDYAHFSGIDYYAPGGLFSMFLETHPGKTAAEFAADARRFLLETNHPDFGVPYADLVYQPMVELIRYLGENAFDVFIVSGSEGDFMRAVSEDKLGIPMNHVIGTRVMLEFVPETDAHIRTREWSTPINDTRFKPVNIRMLLARRPIVAVGNSTGDTQMLEYSHDGDPTTPDLQMLVNHDDPEREKYTYNVELIDSLAQANGWHAISIKNDFARLFGIPGS